LQIDSVAVAALGFNLRHHFHGVAKQFSPPFFPLSRFTKAGQATKEPESRLSAYNTFGLALLPVIYFGFSLLWFHLLLA